MSSNGHKNGNGAKPEREIPPKQAMFIEYYFQNGQNATEAARSAGYNGNDVTLGQIGYQLLNKHNLRERQRERAAEAGITSNMVIGVMVSHLFANMEDFIDEDGNVDLKRIKERKLGHLVKAVSHTKHGPRLELHDSFKAGAQLCKILGIERAPIPANSEETDLEKATQALMLIHPGVTKEQARSQILASKAASARVM